MPKGKKAAAAVPAVAAATTVSSRVHPPLLTGSPGCAATDLPFYRPLSLDMRDRLIPDVRGVGCGA